LVDRRYPPHGPIIVQGHPLVNTTTQRTRVPLREAPPTPLCDLPQTSPFRYLTGKGQIRFFLSLFLSESSSRKVTGCIPFLGVDERPGHRYPPSHKRFLDNSCYFFSSPRSATRMSIPRLLFSITTLQEDILFFSHPMFFFFPLTVSLESLDCLLREP